MAFPCETVVWKALPAIKSSLAKALVKAGMTQVQVSKILGTTEATISHYMKGERGSSVVLGKHIQDNIDKLAKKINTGSLSEKQITQEVCSICQQVRDSCAVCGAETSQDCTHCAHT
ncbi:MAG: transcriptional regulator [Candidatus Hermodarchaeia archaeon]|jgi:predicted transcriptional regulator